MERLESYYPDIVCPDDNARVQQLLDMARNIHRTPSTSGEILDELTHYVRYNGGSHGIFHVVRDEARIAAIVHSSWFERSVQFNALAVAPEHRGHGVAQRVLYTLARAAIERSIDDLWVYALRNSHASRVYARLGMVVPPVDDERHVPHGRYFPMSASPRELVEVASGTQPLELVGDLPGTYNRQQEGFVA